MRQLACMKLPLGKVSDGSCGIGVHHDSIPLRDHLVFPDISGLIATSAINGSLTI
ncbi:hypothetical protein [Roseibium sp. M-1]